jgi:hypothetical protein
MFPAAADTVIRVIAAVERHIPPNAAAPIVVDVVFVAPTAFADLLFAVPA